MSTASLYTEYFKPWCNIRVDDLIVDGVLNTIGTVSGDPLPIIEEKVVAVTGFINSFINVLIIKQGNLVTWLLPTIVIPPSTGNVGEDFTIYFDDSEGLIPNNYQPVNASGTKIISRAGDSSDNTIVDRIGEAILSNRIRLYPDPERTLGWNQSIDYQFAIRNPTILQYVSN